MQVSPLSAADSPLTTTPSAAAGGTQTAATDTDTTTNSTTDSSSSSNNPGEISSSEFMTLLVAQLQNQDPTNPVDPTTFVTQLVQFNTLEQVIDINQDLQPASSTGTTSGTTATGQV